MGANLGVMQGYRRTKEKEVRWDGCSEAGVAHSTDEVGEPTWRGPDGGKGRPCYGAVGGNDAGGFELTAHLTRTSTDSMNG